MLFDGLLIEHQCRPQAVAAAGTGDTIVYRNLFLSSLLGRPIQCLSVVIDASDNCSGDFALVLDSMLRSPTTPPRLPTSTIGTVRRATTDTHSCYLGSSSGLSTVAKSLVPYRQCSACTDGRLSQSLVRSGVDTAIWTKPCGDLAGQLLYGDSMQCGNFVSTPILTCTEQF